MKNSVLLLVALIFSVNISSYAQTVDEIIDNYFENTGGADVENESALVVVEPEELYLPITVEA